jgi:GWxTD domain-containing protein
MEKPMKNRIATLLVLILIVTASVSAQDKSEMRKRHKEWIENEVMVITTDTERESFYALETDELRDRFIEIFWEKRDTTPGTGKNEFRDEHMKRLKFANMYFGNRLAQNGYRSDRGRIWTLLGKPQQRYEYSSDTYVYPCELWYYQTDPKYMNSSFFYLIFFKRNGGGDFVLYSPVADSAEDLSVQGHFDESMETVMQGIQRLSPDLAFASQGYDPMDPGNKMRSEVILAEVYSLPERQVDKEWALDFLASKGKVESNYTFVAVNIPNVQFVHTPVDGRQQLHYSFLLRPGNINMGRHEETYYVAYEIIPSLADSEGRVIYEKSNLIEMDWPAAAYSDFKSKPLLFTDDIPLIPGKYTFTVRIRNNTAKTLYYYTKPLEVTVPRSGEFEIGKVFFSYKQEQAEQKRKQPAFNFFNYQFTPSAINAFANVDKLHLFAELYYPVRKGEGNDVEEISYDFKIYDSSDELKAHLTHIVTNEWLSQNNFGIHYLSRQIPIADLPSGDYRLQITASDNAGLYSDIVEKEFRIALPESIARPSVVALESYSKDTPADKLVERGDMLVQAGFVDAAAVEFKSALAQEPKNIKAAIGQAKMLMLKDKAAAAFDILQKVEHVDPNQRQLVIMLAQAANANGKAEAAIGYYQRLLFFEPTDTELLNSLANLYFESGKTAEAVEALQKSIQADPDQPAIKALLEATEK